MPDHQFSRKPKEVPHVRTANRIIQTAIPAPGTEEVMATLEKYESRSMQGQMPIVWERAKDWSIFDHAGNQWIDFTSTIFVTNVGHANPRVLSAVKQTLEGELSHCYAYSSKIRADYLKKLIQFAPKNFEKAFLLSAGTEATEAALKLMRMNGQKAGKKKQGVVCIEGNWHGRTMGAQMMGWNPSQKEWIGYLDPNIHFLPFPYPWVLKEQTGAEFFATSMKKLMDQGLDPETDLCGFMLETFQGWGAVFYPKDYVQAIEKFCRSHGLLLTFDEMQAGFARTGKLFGYQHYEVEPDLICCGKGMGGGFPLSGVLGRAEIMDLPSVGNMSSTHSANPVVCAAGIAVIDEIQDRRLVEETERKGKILFARLEAMRKRFPEHITYILGKGLIAAVIFKENTLPSRVSEASIQKGLLVVHTGRESIKIGPPLIISDEALNEGLDVLEAAIEEQSEKL